MKCKNVSKFTFLMLNLHFLLALGLSSQLSFFSDRWNLQYSRFDQHFFFIATAAMMSEKKSFSHFHGETVIKEKFPSIQLYSLSVQTIPEKMESNRQRLLKGAKVYLRPHC